MRHVPPSSSYDTHDESLMATVHIENERSGSHPQLYTFIAAAWLLYEHVNHFATAFVLAFRFHYFLVCAATNPGSTWYVIHTFNSFCVWSFFQ
jgi:hypothetical protein